MQQNDRSAVLSMLPLLRVAFARIANHHGFRRYFHNVSWMFVEQVARMLAAVLVGILVARYLGPADFGIYSYAVALVSLFGAVARLGLDSVVVRDLINLPERRDIYLGTAFWCKLGGAFGVFALLGITVLLIESSKEVASYIFIIASGLIFQSVDVVDLYFQSKVMSRYVSICRLVQIALSSTLKIYCVFVHAELFWFVLILLIDQISLAISLLVAYRTRHAAIFIAFFDVNVAKAMLKNSWPIVLSGIAVSLYMRVDQIMIREMLGEREVGLYSAAVRLSEAFYFLPVIISASLFPAIVNAKNNSQDLYIRRLQKLYTLLIYLALTIAIPTTFLGDQVVTLLYGQSYQASGSTLAILIWASVFVFFGCAWSSWMLIEGFQSTMFKMHVLTLLTNIALNFYLIPKIGINGAALSTAISYSLGHTLFALIFKNQRIALKMFFRAFNAKNLL